MKREEVGGRGSYKFLQFLTFLPKAQMIGVTFHFIALWNESITIFFNWIIIACTIEIVIPGSRLGPVACNYGKTYMLMNAVKMP